MSQVVSNWNHLRGTWPDGDEFLATDIRKPLLLAEEAPSCGPATDTASLSFPLTDRPGPALHPGLSQSLEAPSPAVLEQWAHLLVQAMASFAPPGAGQSGSGLVDSQGLALAIVSPQ